MKDYSFHLPGSREKGIVLVHGLAGSPPEMRFLAKRFAKMGFTCDAPVMAGHCRDTSTLLKTGYKDWVKSVQQAIVRLKQDVDEVYVAGICVGGGVGLLAAHQLPAGFVSGAAIYSPTLIYNGWNAPWWHRHLHWLVPIVTPLPLSRMIGFNEKLPFGLKSDRIRRAVTKNSGDGIDGTLPAFPLKGLNENFRLNKALKKALPTMTVPTLLIHSRHDDVSGPENAENIKARHGGRCEVIYLEDSYHKIHIDQERQKAAVLTADFFGRPAQVATVPDDEAEPA
jgi:carboxylesterase